MKAEIATLRSEMKADFATKTEMRAALAELRSEVRAWLLVQIGAILAGVTLITRL